MEKLAEALSGSHLTRLDLDNNNITDIGAGKVGCGIAKFPAQMLTLVKNEMTKIGKIKTNLTAKFKAVKTKISL